MLNETCLEIVKEEKSLFGFLIAHIILSVTLWIITWSSGKGCFRNMRMRTFFYSHSVISVSVGSQIRTVIPVRIHCARTSPVQQVAMARI